LKPPSEWPTRSTSAAPVNERTSAMKARMSAADVSIAANPPG
jgi:hypothetical protein